MAFKLRNYEPADFEAISALDRECFPRGIAYSRREIRWYLDQLGADCLLARAEMPSSADAAASALAGFIMTEAHGPEAHIITLDVAEAYRRARVGTALLAEMERRLAARGVERIALETAVKNEAGFAFWQRHGFRTVSVIKRYYLDRLDAYSMLKHLPPTQAAPHR